MFIYFVEQVWNYEGLVGWNRLSDETHETQSSYWDYWGSVSYKYKYAYPPKHFELNNDYVEF